MRLALLFTLPMLVLASVGPTEARSYDHVTDGGFPSPLEDPAFGGWELMNGGTRVDLDRLSSTTSGSLAVTAAASAGRVVATQCIPVYHFLGSIDFRLDGWIRVNEGALSIELLSFDEFDCSGTIIDFNSETRFRGPWTPVRLEGVKSPWVQSIAIQVFAFGIDGPASGWVDDVSMFFGGSQQTGLVLNGSFDPADHSLTAWNFTADGFLASADASGSAHSSSLGAVEKDGTVASQCFAGYGGFEHHPYSLVGTARVFRGEVWFLVNEFTSDDCSGESQTAVRVDIGPNQDWTRVSGYFHWRDGTRSGSVQIYGVKDDTTGEDPYFFIDDIDVIPQICVPGDEYLCLLENRYKVTMSYTLGGQVNQAHAVQLTEESGYFQFFGPANIEASIKMVDGCLVNGKAWVYIGGMTDLPATIEVFDFATGEEFVVSSAGGAPFPGVANVGALPSCPTVGPLYP